MAFSYGFYNSRDRDRLYDAEDMAQIFDGLISDGVFSVIGEHFLVKPTSEENTVLIGSGKAWFNHTWSYNDADYVLTTENKANVLYNRWDAIILEINSSAEFRRNDIRWISGTASENPVKPTMIHTVELNQYPLCYIYRTPKNEFITQSDITMVVGTDECPYSESMLTDTKNIAQVERNPVASQSYAYGEYMLWNDELYVATQFINQGDTIIPYPDDNYNVMRTTIANELYNKLVFDSTPTEGSDHAVTSDGIYQAIKDIKTISYIDTADDSPVNSTAVGDYAFPRKSGGSIYGDTIIKGGNNSEDGYAVLEIGNTSGNRRGRLAIGGPKSTYFHSIYSDATSKNQHVYLPNAGGTIITSECYNVRTIGVLSDTLEAKKSITDSVSVSVSAPSGFSKLYTCCLTGFSRGGSLSGGIVIDDLRVYKETNTSVRVYYGVYNNDSSSNKVVISITILEIWI